MARGVLASNFIVLSIQCPLDNGLFDECTQLATLDLREQRCPMALLLTKRHVLALALGEKCTILVQEASAKSDIVRFLSQHSFHVDCVELYNYYSLYVTKGTKLDVRNGESLV